MGCLILQAALLFLRLHLAGATLVTNDTALAAGQTSDYIVVGAGLSGITVTNKLSARNYSVLIIEAGPDGSWNNVIYNALDRQFRPINGMIWYRPTAAEIDGLQRLGNPGWNWVNLEPYMQAIERNIPSSVMHTAQGAGLDPIVRAFSGAIKVSFQGIPYAFHGLSITDDLSNRTASVSASTSWTIWYDPVTRQNKRSSAADGVLWAADQQRETLTVLATHKVDRVLFDMDIRAVGVSFMAFNMTDRSGIGKKSVLDAAGILEQVVELPGVGGHLLHEEYWNDTALFDEPHMFAPEVSLVNVDELTLTHIQNLTSPNVLASRAQGLVRAGGAANVEGAKTLLNATINLIVNSRPGSSRSSGVFMATFWPVTPLSRGHIHIDPDPALGDPIIDAYYSPEKAGPDATDAEYLEWYRENMGPADRWVGSTAMLPRELGGVVDERLRVYGTRGLRVVDAGILPYELTSHLMSAVYAIALRAADLILADV
ncbi:GMC oxidoreductase [Coniochaeta sp. 2T2.1]|nr:GMC oxidoreductase [Coniochaeta sp. 2T2.1]